MAGIFPDPLDTPPLWGGVVHLEYAFIATICRPFCTPAAMVAALLMRWRWIRHR